jgi:hypothetical protein
MSLARLASSPSSSRADARREPGVPLSAFHGVTLLEVVQRGVHHVLRLSVDHRRERGRRLRIELRAGALVDVDGLGAGRAGDVERDRCLLSPCLIRVAVPDSPELLCGDSFTVAESVAEAVKLPAPGVQQF